MAGDWVQETVAVWRQWAAIRRSLRYDEVEMTLKACANKLERIWDEPLTVREAAEESGYCPGTLYKLIRNGTEFCTPTAYGEVTYLPRTASPEMRATCPVGHEN